VALIGLDQKKGLGKFGLRKGTIYFLLGDNGAGLGLIAKKLPFKSQF